MCVYDPTPAPPPLPNPVSHTAMLSTLVRHGAAVPLARLALPLRVPSPYTFIRKLSDVPPPAPVAKPRPIKGFYVNKIVNKRSKWFYVAATLGGLCVASLAFVSYGIGARGDCVCVAVSVAVPGCLCCCSVPSV